MNIYNTNFDFNSYKNFLVVYEYRSFSKASKILHISQPAISYSIKKLENELGVELFKRLSREVLPTKYAEKFKFYLDRAFDNILVGYKTINECNEELVGEVTIGIHSHIGAFLLPKYIKNFIKDNPKVKINIFNSITSDLKKKFESKEIDILILHYPIFKEETKYYERKILKCDSCFFTNHDTYNKINNLKKQNIPYKYSLALPMKGYITSECLEKEFLKHDEKFTADIYVYTTEMMKGLVKGGEFVGWALKNTIKDELDNNEFYELKTDIINPIMEFSIAYDLVLSSTTTLRLAKYLEENIKIDY